MSVDLGVARSQEGGVNDWVDGVNNKNKKENSRTMWTLAFS